MKKILLPLMIGLVFPFPSLADEPVAQMTFQVGEDTGAVVTGAVVRVSTFERWQPGPGFGKDIHRQVEGVTDTNGLATIALPSVRGSVKYNVSVNGQYFDNIMKMNVAGETYYRDMGGEFYFTNSTAGRWQPWNPLINIQLKRVIKPIPMYALSYGSDWNNHNVPEYNKTIGFDLIKGDWIVPYGKGEVADFIFTLDCKLGGQTSSRYQIFDAMLTLAFANDGDGIQPVLSHPLEGSALRLPRFAPEGGYTSSWSKVTFRHEGEGFHEIDEDQNYFFRVRTKKDESGEITSALYGKIHGMIDYEIRSTGNQLKFTYYLNPNPNDRNLEFDPKQNLFTNLPAVQLPYKP